MSQSIILGGGCFWCTEAIFQRVPGVLQVVPGYCGGAESHPSYQMICSKLTRHAEVIRIEYDPEILTLQSLFEIFWLTHDPTTVDQQGADMGPQYRSIIFPADAEEESIAHAVRQELQPHFEQAIVTEIVPHTQTHPFWQAEQDHHNYYNDHPTQGYCHYVITPKVEKLKQLLKPLS